MHKLTTIAAYQFVAEAELLQSRLVEEGIQAFLADDNLIAMDWLMSNAVGGVKVQVAANDIEAAQRVVAEFENRRRQRNQGERAHQNIVFNCENCNQQIEFPGNRRGGVETCAHCGRYVDVPE